MVKKAKEESLDLFYSSNEKENKSKKINSSVTNKKGNGKNKKNNSSKNRTKNNNKIKDENTKDEMFNFDDEIIIGLKRIDNREKKNNKSNNKKKQKESQKNQSKTKQGQVVKNVKKKLTPKQELAKKKRQAVFKLIKWLTLVGIIIGATIYTILSPIFNVKKVEVAGNSLISEEKIISLSQIEIDNNMFKYNKNNIIKNIKENAYVEDVKVKRKIPDTIQIEIVERQVTFMIKFANAYAYINNQGYILEISDKKQELPIIVGIKTETEGIQEGKRLCNEDLIQLNDILKIMEAATSNEISDLITQIDITDNENYKLTIQKQNKVVHLGDTSNLSTKMLWIKKFNELEGNTAGEIILNMNLNDEKNKPYFRKSI